MWMQASPVNSPTIVCDGEVEWAASNEASGQVRSRKKEKHKKSAVSRPVQRISDLKTRCSGFLLLQLLWRRSSSSSSSSKGPAGEGEVQGDCEDFCD